MARRLCMYLISFCKPSLSWNLCVSMSVGIISMTIVLCFFVFFLDKSSLELAAMRTGWSIVLASNIPSNAPVLEVFTSF